MRAFVMTSQELEDRFSGRAPVLTSTDFVDLADYMVTHGLVESPVHLWPMDKARLEGWLRRRGQCRESIVMAA